MGALDDIEDLFDSYDMYDEHGRTYCKFCGGEDLEWRLVKGKWKLFGHRGRVHDCRSAPARPSDFEALD